MTPWIEYALGAMVCFGIGDLIYKRGGAAGPQAHHLLMVQSWFFLPAVAVYGLLTGSLTFVAGTLWGAVAGLFMWIGFYNFAFSLKSGSISVNAPIFRLSFVLTAALAVLVLGEPLTGSKVAGIGCALGAVWLLLFTPRRTGRAAATRESRSSLMRVLVATAAVGVGNLVYKYGLRAGATPASLIVAQAAVVVTLSTLLVVAIDRRIRAPALAWRYAPAAAIVLAIAFALMVESLARGEASVVVPIAQMGFTVTAVLGFSLMREPVTPRKVMGLLCAVAALAILAAG